MVYYIYTNLDSKYKEWPQAIHDKSIIIINKKDSKPPCIWELKNAVLNTSWVTGEITMVIKKMLRTITTLMIP